MDDSIVEVEGRPYRMEVVRSIVPVNERVQRLASRLSMEETLVKCIETLAYQPDMTTAVNRFLQLVGEFYHAERAYLFDFDFDKGVLTNTFEWCAAGVAPQIDKLQAIPLEYVDDWVAMFEAEGCFFISSLDENIPVDSPAHSILKMQNIESLAAVPIVKQNRVVGFLGLDNPPDKVVDWVLLRTVVSFITEELEKRRLMRELSRVSYTDTLTGLGNRNKYQRYVNSLEACPSETLGIVFVDINGLKTVNDLFGHKQGDILIQRVAELLRGQFPEHLFRIGGDEFVAFCPGVTAVELDTRVAALRAAIAAAPDCDASIGSVWRSGEFGVEDAVSHADELMYAEKQAYYEEVLRQGGPQRTGLAGDLRRELREGLFEVHYQPQIELHTGRIVGVEALARKRTADGSLLLPSQFLAAYETQGLTRHLDLFVLRCACAALQQWRANGWDLNVAVNFSRMTLAATDIVPTMLGICQQHQIPPGCLTLELTEGVYTLGEQEVTRLATALVEAGFHIALDHFGTHSTDLAPLACMKFEQVKFDKTLVNELATNPRSRALVKNVVRLCHELDNATVLAQGIETEDQLALLKQFDCPLGQGYYYARPLPQGEFEAMFGQRAAEGK